MIARLYQTCKQSFCTTVVLFFSLAVAAQNKTYYISPAGNNGNDGLTTGTAWQTIARVNSFSFQPGDQIRFEGGQTFLGGLEFGADDNGTAASPIVVNSYGTGRAVINSGSVTGFYAYNTGGMEVRDLVFTGNGATVNTANGVEFYMDLTTTSLDHVVVSKAETYGYGGRGIFIGCWGTPKGYNDVSVTDCDAHDNGHAGIEVYDESWRFCHRNVYVGRCKAYRNYGRSDYTQNHSGNGIILGSIDGALIEYCEAYENGQNNANIGGGPVGIWYHNVKNGVIQFCESHHNKAGQEADGGGFDLDGGCQNCVIQYCYSHENEGAGFALFEYGSTNAFFNNTLRYNISQNDGRKNGYAGIALWGADDQHKVQGCHAYNNTVYVDNATAVVSGTPAAVMVLGNHLENVRLRNNLFYASGGARMISATSSADTTALLFQGNNYYAPGGGAFAWGANTYASLLLWKAAVTGQETNGATAVGSTANPQLVNAGGGGTIGPASGGSLANLTAYQLQGTSPLIDGALNLPALFGISIGTRDFYNNAIPVSGAYDVGAHEFRFIALPLNAVMLNGVLSENTLQINCVANCARPVSSLVLEASTDAQNFSPLKVYKQASPAAQVQLTESIAGRYPDVLFCRAKTIGVNGELLYSKIIRLQKTQGRNTLTVYPVPADHTLYLTSSLPFKAGWLSLYNAAGQVVLHQRMLAGQTTQAVAIGTLATGMYRGEINDGLAQKQVFVFVKQ